MSLKFYIATGIDRAHIHNHVRDSLIELGYELTYDWTLHGSVQSTSYDRLQEVAHNETNAILQSDFIILLLPGGKGTHSELGISIGSGKKIFLHSEDPAQFTLGDQVCAFYHHQSVTRLTCPIDRIGSQIQEILLPIEA